MEELELYIDDAQDHMEKSVKHLAHELTKIRAGRAMPNMVDDIYIDYYGAQTPLSQVASINTPDARTLMIKPWEKNILGEIEKTIINSDLGLNPQNDGEVIRLNIPPLTEERRISLVKQVKHEGENGRISIRNIRKEANDHVKKLLKENVSEDEVKKAEQQIQELTDSYIKKVDELLTKKETEIMHV